MTQLAAGESVALGSSEGGNDHLYGGIGNDTLEGGAGNDWLEGTNAIAFGYFEKDILVGGLGNDTFVLGNSSQAYYLGNGDKDYATIQDFNASEDLVQLHGSTSHYSLQQQGSDTYVYHTVSDTDLIAVLKNVNGANFATGFTFS